MGIVVLLARFTCASLIRSLGEDDLSCHHFKRKEVEVLLGDGAGMR